MRCGGVVVFIRLRAGDVCFLILSSFQSTFDWNFYPLSKMTTLKYLNFSKVR